MGMTYPPNSLLNKLYARPKKDERDSDYVDVTDQNEETQPLSEEDRGDYPFGDPVAVEIVRQTPAITIPKAAASWQSQHIRVQPASLGPTLIVGANPRRREVLLWITGNGKSVAIGPSTAVKYPSNDGGGSPGWGNCLISANSGFGGTPVRLPIQSEIWAVCDPTTTTGGEALEIIEIIEDGQ